MPTSIVGTVLGQKIIDYILNNISFNYFSPKFSVKKELRY